MFLNTALRRKQRWLEDALNMTHITERCPDSCRIIKETPIQSLGILRRDLKACTLLSNVKKRPITNHNI